MFYYDREGYSVGGYMYDKAVIEGYAPPDLILRLELVPWQAVYMGKNFLGLKFGNSVLADPYDPYCPFRHRVNVAEIPCGKIFHIEGYAVENLCIGIRGKNYIPVIAGCELEDLPLHKIGALIPYRLTIECIT